MLLLYFSGFRPRGLLFFPHEKLFVIRLNLKALHLEDSEIQLQKKLNHHFAM